MLKVNQEVKFIGNPLCYKSMTNNVKIVEINDDPFVCFPYLLEFEDKKRIWASEIEIEPIEIVN